MSGPHDFAVRIGSARLAPPKRPSHPAPNVRDDRETPLRRGGMGRACKDDLPDNESEKFFATGLDSRSKSARRALKKLLLWSRLFRKHRFASRAAICPHR